MNKPKPAPDHEFRKRAEIVIPSLIIFVSSLWIVASGYLIKPYQSWSSHFTDADNLWSVLIILLAAAGAYLLIKKFREKDMQYKSLFDCSPLPKWIFDKTTLQFLDVNQAAIKHYGYSRAEFLNMTIMDVRPPAEHERLRIQLEAARGGEEDQDIWTHRKKNGDEISVSVTAGDVFFKNNTRRLCVITDITDMLKAHENRRLAEEAAREKAVKLEAQNHKLKEIAFKASHLMRAPLTNVLGLVNLMNDPGLTIDEKQALFAPLKIAGERLDLIIRQIVAETFSKQELVKDWAGTHKAILSATPGINVSTLN